MRNHEIRFEIAGDFTAEIGPDFFFIRGLLLLRSYVSSNTCLYEEKYVTLSNYLVAERKDLKLFLVIGIL